MNYKAALNVMIRDVGDSEVWGLGGIIETMTVFVSIPSGLASSPCLLPQTTIHRSSRDQQQRAESRAVQGNNSIESIVNYLAFNQSSSRPVPSTEQAKTWLIGMNLSGAVGLDH